MKRAGIIIMVIGVVMTIYTGFNYITREKVVDIGKLEITADKKHRFDWSPLFGVVVIAVGAGVFLLSAKKNVA